MFQDSPDLQELQFLTNTDTASLRQDLDPSNVSIYFQEETRLVMMVVVSIGDVLGSITLHLHRVASLALLFVVRYCRDNYNGHGGHVIRMTLRVSRDRR